MLHVVRYIDLHWPYRRRKTYARNFRWLRCRFFLYTSQTPKTLIIRTGALLEMKFHKLACFKEMFLSTFPDSDIEFRKCGKNVRWSGGSSCSWLPCSSSPAHTGTWSLSANFINVCETSFEISLTCVMSTEHSNLSTLAEVSSPRVENRTDCDLEGSFRLYPYPRRQGQPKLKKIIILRAWTEALFLRSLTSKASTLAIKRDSCTLKRTGFLLQNPLCRAKARMSADWPALLVLVWKDELVSHSLALYCSKGASVITISIITIIK